MGCVQGFLLVFGMGTDVLVLTAFVDMYSKMGEHKRARSVFIFQYHACKKSGFMECYHLRVCSELFSKRIFLSVSEISINWWQF